MRGAGADDASLLNRPWAGPVVVVVLVGALAATGCRKQGCLGGDDRTCVPASACQRLAYSCAGGRVRITRVSGPGGRSPGTKAQAAVGDFVLENDRVRAVLDAPEHSQGLAPTGGSILDFAPLSVAGGDQLNGIFQGAGLLPRDAVHYESSEVIDHSNMTASEAPLVALVFRGHLEGDRRVTVVTRYELRPCEPGLRVRTELYNGAPDPNTFALTDGYFWGDRTLLPFVPLRGQGFLQPELDLLNLAAAWRTWPFMAARPQVAPYASYAMVPCDADTGAGFNEATLSAAGVALRPTLPGDAVSFERFIIASTGPGLAPAVGEALVARSLIHGGPPPVAVTGRVVVGGVPFDSREGRAASLLVYQPGPGDRPESLDAPDARTPWSEAVPAPDGSFRFVVPANADYRLQPFAFGRPVGSARAFSVARDELDLGDVEVVRSAHLSITVTDDGQTATDFADVVLVPADGAGTGGGPGTLYDVFGPCEPMLGPPHGASPACNRAVTIDGHVELLVPPGHFFVYATRGPFAAIARQEITIAPGDDVTLLLTVRSLPGLLPAGVLSGDFHVHGGASYDSSIPDQERVLSFLAHGIDVIVATDHDVVSTYAETLRALAVPDARLRIIPGVEATPNVLWFTVPGEKFPKTVGHFNFWPLVANPLAARNGAPWDELAEPGALMDAMELLFRSGGIAAVRQMNHPWSDAKLGRDQGFLRMIGYDPRTPIREHASFAADVLLRRPGGGHRNLDWDIQEVMTGADRVQWLRYRRLWFSLLSQGLLKAGAANSDSHSFSVEQVGTPRNLVWTAETLDGFDADRFDADVRAGHMVGTTGPVLDVHVAATDGTVSHRPGLTPFVPAAGDRLVAEVRAAPWIPVHELRVIVNGTVTQTIALGATFAGIDPLGEQFGAAVVDLALGDLLAGVAAGGDAWIVVEAGMPVPANAIDPDTGVPDITDAASLLPPGPADPLFHVESIAPGVWPTAFSNPLLVDGDGNGWTAPGLPEVARP